MKLKKKDLTSYKKFYILITHTHGDHIGGLGLLVQFIFFVLKKTAIIAGINTIYTGDTCTLNNFLPFLTDNSELYVDTSVYYGKIHLKLEDVLNDFINLTKRGIKIYLMHLDDISAAEKIVADIPGIEVVQLTE